MHIAPSGSPQPTKQAFICKLYSGFPRISSQQKPHRRICIPQGARNAVLRETQPETSNLFSAMFFRKTRKMSADVQAYFKRNLTPYSGNSARTPAHFSVMFFRKTKKLSADVQAYFKRNLTPYSGNSARTPAHFSVMFFRKTRLLSRRCICIPQGARNEVLQESQPEPQLIFRRCFFRKTRKMSDGVLSVLRAKFDAVFRELSPKPQIIFR